MNRLGMLVDLSHVSDDVMRQAIDLSEAPVVFSHSSARALADVTRNVPDDVLEAVGRTRGVVMVTFVPSFLTAEGAAINRLGWEEAARLREEHPDDPGAVTRAMDDWFAEHEVPPPSPTSPTTSTTCARSPASTRSASAATSTGRRTMPEGLADVAGYPALFTELARRGYTDEELAKIAGRNVLRADAIRRSRRRVVGCER